jgi:hypothetical protein
MSLLFLPLCWQCLLIVGAQISTTVLLVDICGVSHESTVPTTVLAMLADCGSTDIYYSFVGRYLWGES